MPPQTPPPSRRYPEWLRPLVKNASERHFRLISEASKPIDAAVVFLGLEEKYPFRLETSVHDGLCRSGQFKGKTLVITSFPQFGPDVELLVMVLTEHGCSEMHLIGLAGSLKNTGEIGQFGLLGPEGSDTEHSRLRSSGLLIERGTLASSSPPVWRAASVEHLADETPEHLLDLRVSGYDVVTWDAAMIARLRERYGLSGVDLRVISNRPVTGPASPEKLDDSYRFYRGCIEAQTWLENVIGQDVTGVNLP